MKSKSKSTSRPVYSSQIEGAANNVTSAYNAQAPKITGITDQLGTVVPGLLERYTKGDPNITAAAGYGSDVLSGKYLDSNPHLEAMIERSNSDVSNRLAASLGTRGLTGGSAFGDIISRAVADNGNTLRFNNYNTERGRMDSAAAMAPQLASAQYLPIGIMQSIAQSQQLPVQTASGAASGVGGLLGQYTTQTTSSVPSIGMLLAQIAGNAASAYAGGGFK